MPKITYNRQLWLLLLPYLVGTFILVMIPAMATAVTAFTHYNALQPPTWVGLALGAECGPLGHRPAIPIHDWRRLHHFAGGTE